MLEAIITLEKMVPFGLKLKPLSNNILPVPFPEGIPKHFMKSNDWSLVVLPQRNLVWEPPGKHLPRPCQEIMPDKWKRGLASPSLLSYHTDMYPGEGWALPWKITLLDKEVYQKTPTPWPSLVLHNPPKRYSLFLESYQLKLSRVCGAF